jgi:hypothetical protein
MEETNNTQEQTVTAAKDTPSGETSTSAKKIEPERLVTLETTVNGETARNELRFNTPQILERVKQLDDAATVKIIVTGRDGADDRVLLDGTKAQAVTALEASVMPFEKIPDHLQGIMRTVIDHSTMKAVAVSGVCTVEDGKAAVFGFVSTSPDATRVLGALLVNGTDENIDEFIRTAGIEVPGRTTKPVNGVITPTPEQVEELGK